MSSSAIILLAAGPSFLDLTGFLSDASSLPEESKISVSTFPSLNSAISSELLTTSPSCLTILVRVPSTGARTSRTTLSVSISAITSSCLTPSPSFLTQLAIVPSATDSGNVGDLISILILFLH